VLADLLCCIECVLQCSALCLPTSSHFLIVIKTSLSLHTGPWSAVDPSWISAALKLSVCWLFIFNFKVTEPSPLRHTSGVRQSHLNPKLKSSHLNPTSHTLNPPPPRFDFPLSLSLWEVTVYAMQLVSLSPPPSTPFPPAPKGRPTRTPP
jgi:hypothetical protein